jgi:hypothetical protein
MVHGRAVLADQKAPLPTTAGPTVEVSPSKPKTFLETNKISEAQLQTLIKNLKNALATRDEREKAKVIQSFRHWLPQDVRNIELLIENMQWETDQETIATLGKMVLESGSTTSRQAIVDAALNFLLSDDLVARRQASLQILSDASELNSDLLQAVSRVSREDELPEIRIGAIDTMAAWMKRLPDWAPRISDELLNTLQHSEDRNVQHHADAALSGHHNL